LERGSISLPVVLFTEYKKVGLTEKEIMLLLHLILFEEKEQKFFPTVSELEERMSLSTVEIIPLLQSLVRGGFLEIEEEVNKEGLRCERYCTTPLIQQVVASYIDREKESPSEEREVYQNLFHKFEQEFGRVLSPLECEALTQWIDEDRYDEVLIEAALREAVFCGKVNIRYIDRILLEWQRNKVLTPVDAVNYSRKFRQKGVLYQSTKTDEKPKEKVSSGFSFYNWINHK
jgi:DNA replication protein